MTYTQKVIVLYVTIIALLCLGLFWDAHAADLTGATLDPLKEYRTCTVTPHRDKDGSISRRRDVLEAYRKLYPCPSTGKKTGACPGYALDHSKPLACGGCDAVFNLSWLANETKSCKSVYCKDRWERKVYCDPPQFN